MLELFPEGFEEGSAQERHRARGLWRRRAARRRCERNSSGVEAVRRRGGAGRIAGGHSTCGVRVGVALGRPALGGASRGRDGGRHRPGPCLRDGSASDNAALPRAALSVFRRARFSKPAAAPACSLSPRRSSASRRWLALDDDPAAIEATIRNAEANDVEIEARLADVLADPPPSAETAVANVSLEVVRALGTCLDAPRFVTSGYLAADAFDQLGWAREDRAELDGWAADLWRQRE